MQRKLSSLHAQRYMERQPLDKMRLQNSLGFVQTQNVDYPTPVGSRPVQS